MCRLIFRIVTQKRGASSRLIGPIHSRPRMHNKTPFSHRFFRFRTISYSASHYRSSTMSNSMSRRCRNVCLFGLSADPPTGTGGHVGIVQALTKLRAPPAQQAEDDGDGDDDNDNDDRFAFDEIRVLPVYRHTYADKRQRLETFEHRWNMCRAAFGGMPRVTVSDAEYQSWLDAVQDVPLDQQDQVSVGTASLIAYLTRNKQTNNNNANKVNDEGEEEVVEQFSFVMGADTFLDLTAGKWKESARVLDLLQGRLVVLERLTLTTTTTASTCTTTDDDNNAAHADTTADTADHMAAAVALQKAVEAVPGARLLRVENLNNTSSSQVRECHSRPVAEIQEQNMVVPAVLEYMCQHGLYGYGKQDGNVEHECS